MARTRQRAASVSSQIVQRAKRPIAKVEPEEEFDVNNFVSSGSTLLNLALTEHPNCGWQKGKMANLIGDSGVGKTLLALTTFAEAAYNPKQKDISMVFDDAENALEFNLSRIFGEETEQRVEILNPPSDNIEQFSDNLAKTIKKKAPFIYILDSFDAIGSEADTEHIEAERKIRNGESNKKSTGSYGMAKPKLASQLLREECGKLKQTKGVLLIVSQTRDNLTPGSYEKKTRSGGKALKFYATHEVWIIYKGALTSNNKRRIGAECDIKVTKNKVTGKKRTVSFSIFDGYGIDDIGSMIDFLLDEKVWTGTSNAINTKNDLGFKETITRKALITHIETKGLEKTLKKIVTEVWLDIEEELKPKRKHKYE